MFLHRWNNVVYPFDLKFPSNPSSSVHGHDRAGHEGRAIAEQPARDLRDLFRLGHPTERNTRDAEALALLAVIGAQTLAMR